MALLFYTLLHDSGGVLWSHVGCSSVHLSVVLFPNDNLSKYQWIFVKLSICIDIVEFWLGIVNGQISSIFICLPHVYVFVSGG